MNNNLILVGRLTKEAKLKEVGGNTFTKITIAIPKPYKNVNGEYETDFFEITLWGPTAKNVVEYCGKGDLIGISGRLQTRTIENKDGIKKQIMEIIGEKVTYLSSSNKNK